jgi:TonB family protein
MRDRFFLTAVGDCLGQVSRVSFLTLTVAVAGLGVSIAQEPALLQGHSAVRFEEAPGVFHYITPCTETKPYADHEAATALCWRVRAAHVERIDGKLVQSAVSRGVVRITADVVGFVPDVPSADMPLTTFPRSAVTFGHKAGATEARYGSDVSVTLFAFENICFDTCKLVPEAVPASQVDTEFELFHEALTSFAAVAERLNGLSQQLRVKVTPGTEPDASASAEILSKYAELNRRLADATTETAKSCLLQYASYQSCKAGAARVSCAATPDCTAEFVLPKDFNSKGLAIVMRPTSDVVDLRPEGLPVRISAGLVALQILVKTNPVYPSMAKERHLSGAVVLHAIIAKDGSVQSLKVLSDTDPILNDAATDAVRKWRYKPYLLNGNPIDVDTTITVNFNFSVSPSGFGSQDPSRPMSMPPH